MSALSARISTLVARLLLSSWTCSFARASGLLFRKAAFCQIFDKSMGIKGDRFIHTIILVRDMTKCNASHSL